MAKRKPDLRPLGDALITKLDEGFEGIDVIARLDKDSIEEEDGKDINLHYREDYLYFEPFYSMPEDEKFFDHERWWDKFADMLLEHFDVPGMGDVVVVPPRRPCLSPVGTLMIFSPRGNSQDMEVYYQTESSLELSKRRSKENAPKSKQVVRDGRILVDENGVRLGPQLRDALSLVHIHGIVTDADTIRARERLTKFAAKYPEAFPRARKKRR